MSLLQNSNAISSGSYDLNNSLRFRSSASAYLNRTPTVAGNQQKFTWSGWVKIGYFTTGYLQAADGNSGNRMTSWYMRGLGSTGVFEFEHYDGTTTYNLTTNAVFRDPSAWYHITVAIDTTQATSANRTKIYVNGNEQTVTGTYVPQNTSLYVNGTTIQAIGSRKNVNGGYGAYFDGYMADINFIDGQALTPSSFGETDTTTGVWKPKAYTSTYGTNGFYLKFSDIATTSGSNAGLGKDFSGNANYWNTNNISVTSGTTYDAMIDSPTNASSGTRPVGNYATLNPIQTATANITWANANLQASLGTTAAWRTAISTMAVDSGKWYAEFTVTTGVTANSAIGIVPITDSYSGSYLPGSSAGSYGYPNDGTKYNNGSNTSYGSSWTTGDIIGIAYDGTNNKIWFSKNGTWQASGDPAAGTNAAFTTNSGVAYYFAVAGASATQSVFNCNFGQRSFAYTPPTGYQALCTTNLPTPTILQGNKYMDAVLWTGDGTLSRNITGLNFATDFVWLKSRGADSHKLYDIIRGAGNNKELESNTTVAEGGSNSDVYGYMSAFLSNGFTVAGGTDSGYPVGLVNQSGQGYVAWNWKANGAGSSNTAGSITGTVSVNTTAGFSVVTYTGTGANATVGHGLGVAPRMIIFKQRNAVRGWIVYHASLANASTVIYLNVTNAANTDATAFNATAPTSSVFSVGTSADTNQSTGTYVAYCFAEIAGFSKFGSYTGNGSADGPFVYLGFRPKWLLIKQTDVSRNWILVDSSRNTYNIVNLPLLPNDSAAEYTSTTTVFDFVSNGFKIRSSHVEANGSSNSYIYAAFAENPFASNNRAR